MSFPKSGPLFVGSCLALSACVDIAGCCPLPALVSGFDRLPQPERCPLWTFFVCFRSNVSNPRFVPYFFPSVFWLYSHVFTPEYSSSVFPFLVSVFQRVSGTLTNVRPPRPQARPIRGTPGTEAVGPRGRRQEGSRTPDALPPLRDAGEV